MQTASVSSRRMRLPRPGGAYRKRIRSASGCCLRPSRVRRSLAKSQPWSTTSSGSGRRSPGTAAAGPWTTWWSSASRRRTAGRGRCSGLSPCMWPQATDSPPRSRGGRNGRPVPRRPGPAARERRRLLRARRVADHPHQRTASGHLAHRRGTLPPTGPARCGPSPDRPPHPGSVGLQAALPEPLPHPLDRLPRRNRVVAQRERDAEASYFATPSLWNGRTSTATAPRVASAEVVCRRPLGDLVRGSIG